MSRILFTLVTLACLISLATGCRNCRLNPCNNAYGLAASQTLPSPPTYSLQIPSLGQNQPYYNGVPTTARQPSYLVNPNTAAPTPASNTPTLAPQNGWRPVGSNQYSATTNAAAPNQGQQNQPTSVLQSQPNNSTNRAPTGFASQPKPATQMNSVMQPGQNRTASATNGLSFQDSINYRSTRVDERMDGTRLPATDATGVRAPSNLSTVPARTQFAQAVPIYGAVVPSQPVYSAQPTVVTSYPGTLSNPYTQTQLVQRSQPGFIQGTVVYGQPSNTYNAYPGGYAFPANSQPAVLASSTTTYSPQNGQNYDAGWRDRELTARR